MAANEHDDLSDDGWVLVDVNDQTEHWVYEGLLEPRTPPAPIEVKAVFLADEVWVKEPDGSWALLEDDDQ